MGERHLAVHLTPSPSPCSLAAALWGRSGLRLQNTLWLCSKSRAPAGFLSQEVREANKKARCEGFSPGFGAAQLPQETWVPVQPGSLVAGSTGVGLGQSPRGASSLPAAQPLGSHYSPGRARQHGENRNSWDRSIQT